MLTILNITDILFKIFYNIYYVEVLHILIHKLWFKIVGSVKYLRKVFEGSRFLKVFERILSKAMFI